MAESFFAGGQRAALSLSFDDARVTQAELGIPLLDRYGIRATFYVSPDNIGARSGKWKQAITAGHEIGNHSLHHPCTGNFAWSRAKALEDYTLERMEEELLAANRVIEELLGVTPTTFAYPCGQTFVGRGDRLHSYIPVVARRFAAGRGFKAEVANDPAFVDLAHVYAFDSDERTFEELKILVDAAIEQGRWLVLAGHEMASDGGQTTRLDALEELCRYCVSRRNDLWVAPVAQIAEAIRSHRATAAQSA